MNEKTRPGGQRCVLKPLFNFSFFLCHIHFFYDIFIFSLSSSLLPPRYSLPLVAPSSSSLFLPRPALSTAFRFRKRPFFIDFDESVTDGRTDGRTEKASYRDARTHLTRPIRATMRPHYNEMIVWWWDYMRHHYLRSKSSIFPFLMKASLTDGPTDRRTGPHIEMRGRI